MGEFFDSIKDDLQALPDTPAEPLTAFGTDYDSNATVVKKVQAAINALGYQPALAIDGAYGPNTKAGVQWLQAQKGLATDGIIGDQTLGALGITPPGGTSVQSVTGAVTGALADVLNEFSSLVSWSANNPQPITQGKGTASGFQATRASVVNSFVDWNKPLEGWVPWMYIDALGYVTTGMGNKIDPISQALALPWQNADGSRATADQITAAWNAVDALRSDPKGQKQTSGPATAGGGTQGGYTSLRITPDAIKTTIASMMKSNEAGILKAMPGFAQAPADAQMAAHSMSWAMGPGHLSTDFTQFTNAFNSGDYQTAADQSHMAGVGIDMRNMANKLLLQNAAIVRSKGFNPDTLYYLEGLSQLFGAGSVSPIAALRSIMSHKGRTIGIAAGVLALVGLLFGIIVGVRHKPEPPKELSA